MKTLFLPFVILIASPAAAQLGRSVYVAQVGDANRANVVQRAAAATAEVVQRGDRNDVMLTQAGSDAMRAEVRQQGDDNRALARQGGLGASTLSLTQIGRGNFVEARQTSEVSANAAAIRQNGDGNRLALTQSGGDNTADLAQTGNGNTMVAEQTGVGNRLAWTQQGNGLSALSIAQTGGQTIQVVQSR